MHGLHAQQLSRFNPAMPGHDLTCIRDQNRIYKPEPLDGCCYLLDLLLGMRTRISAVRPEAYHLTLNDAEG